MNFILQMYLYWIQTMMISLILFIMSLFFKLTNIDFLLEWMFLNINSSQLIMIIYIDWMFLLFSSTILFISSMIMIYSTNYMKNDSSIKKFMFLIFLFVLSMIFMIISPSPLSMILGWDFLGLISYILIIFFQNYKSYSAGMITILSNRIGDIMLILSIIFLTSNGSWNLLFSHKSSLFYQFIFFFLIICSMTKSAQIPFSSWLPQAMAAPTPISALVHSSTLVTAGIYVILRWNKMFFYLNLNKIFMFLSLMTMLMSGMMANFEFDLKKIIALSTLSQMAFMMFSLSLNLNNYTFFHLLNHAIFKSMMFMCAGIMIHNMNNNQDIRFSNNLCKELPIITLIFSMASLSLSGLFFLSGFYSKDFIVEQSMMIKFNLLILILFILASSLTFIYSIRLIFFLYFFKTKSYSINLIHNDWKMNFSMFISFILTLIMGSLFMWIFFDKENIIIIPLFLKLIMIIILILMFILFYLINLINLKNFFFWNLKFIKIFMNNMWFLDLMIKKYSPMFSFSKFFFFNFDKGWIENYSTNFFLFIIKLFKFSYFSLNLNILIIFLWLFIFKLLLN